MAMKRTANKETAPAKRPARTSGTDERQLDRWFTQFDVKVDALTARLDAFLHYPELHQPRPS